MVDFTEKLSYTQSYPHYPQKLDVEYQIYIKQKETNVLVNNNENRKIAKKIINPIDIFIVKILKSFSVKRVILMFQTIII